MDKIEPTTIIDKEKNESYKLEDKDYLLIMAIRELTKELNMARKNG